MSSSTGAKYQPQQHLLPKQAQNSRIGSMNNELEAKKRKYIIEMRKSLSDKNIIFPDGSLNLKYFNVKKGQYWSKEENRVLIQKVITYGPTAFAEIKKPRKDPSKQDGIDHGLENWTETEIRLRVCKLLKVYNLKPYEGRKFASEEEIF